MSAVLFSTPDSCLPDHHLVTSTPHTPLAMPAFPNPLFLYKRHPPSPNCSSCTDLSRAPGMARICAHSTET